jgi:hypothetical protein
MDASDVTPIAAAPAAAPEVTAAAPAPAPDTTAAAPPEKMPEALLRVPAMQGLMTGSPGAVSDNIKDFSKRGDAEVLVKNKDWLTQAGFGFYRSLDGETGVVFNALYVHPDELKAADAAGKLKEVAPDYDSVNHAIGKSGRAHPALSAGPVPKGLKGAPIPQPPQMAQVPPPTANIPPPSAAAQKSLMGARVTNLQPGSPTSGPVPGAGRLLNQVLKPVL